MWRGGSWLPGDKEILFADMVTKVNKRFKMQERILLITTNYIYNIDPSNYKVRAPRTASSHRCLGRYACLSFGVREHELMVLVRCGRSSGRSPSAKWHPSGTQPHARTR